jgi:hypothetical protein
MYFCKPASKLPKVSYLEDSVYAIVLHTQCSVSLVQASASLFVCFVSVHSRGMQTILSGSHTHTHIHIHTYLEGSVSAGVEGSLGRTLSLGDSLEPAYVS